MSNSLKAVTIGLLSLLVMKSAIAEDRPNIVFIIADDLTFSDIGCYGSHNVETPHIDSLAEEGIRFTRCFQASAMCSPTRHNIYTGLYPVKSGAYPNSTLAYDGTKSVAHYLSEVGYSVSLTGKIHVWPESVFPFEYLNKDEDPESYENDPDLEAVETFLARDPNQPSCTFICYNEPHTP